jgi:hypothetical protein
MFKIYSILIGENPGYTDKFQVASKRKIVLYANCLMIPVILWFINSFLLVSHVLEAGMLAALVTSLIAAFIIFLIERAIIMANGSKSIVCFRIFLGLIVASLGSISFDEVIFKNDIDNKVAEYKNQAIDSAASKVEKAYQNEIEVQEQNVVQKAAIWNQSLEDAKKEADGTGGSHQKLVGKIAVLKMNVANKHEREYDLASNQLATLKAKKDSLKNESKRKAESDFNGNALLLRIRAMFQLLGEDGYMLTVYVLFTCFLFCLEFLVVVIKMGTKNSVDEDMEKAREILIREKTRKILERKAMVFEPEQFLPSVQEARKLISKKNASIF